MSPDNITLPGEQVQPGPDTPETAYRDSDAFEFLGRPLHPFTFVRHTAAIALGLRYWRLSPSDLYTVKVPKPPEEGETPDPASPPELVDTPMYDDIFTDIAVVLWLCHQPDSICRRARRKPADYEAEIDAWAEKMRIGFGGANQEEASLLFARIVGAVSASKGVPDVGDKNGAPGSASSKV